MDKKIIILDFDGTLYSGKNMFSEIPEFVNQNKRKMIPNITDSEYTQIVKENPTWADAWYGNDLARHIYGFIEKYPDFNIKIKDFLDWEASCIEPVNINKNEVVDTKFLEQLCKDFHVYIVSNSLQNHIKHYMKILNVNYNWFAGVLSNRFMKKDMTKKPYYLKVLKKENCRPENIYVFGDSNKSDIVPAKELGMNGFEIPSATMIPEIVKKALNIK